MAQLQSNVQQRSRFIGLVSAAVVLLALGACAAGTGASHHAAAQGPLDQFVLGIWHGVIAPVALAVEILNRFAPHLIPWRFHLYETSAAGLPYDVGFYVGAIGGPWAAWTRGPWR